jgi:spoIIIJ-associated protein
VSAAENERVEELAEVNETPVGTAGEDLSENRASGGETKRSQRSRRRRLPKDDRPPGVAGVSAQSVGANGAGAVSTGAGRSTVQALEHEGAQGNSERAGKTGRAGGTSKAGRAGRAGATKEEAVGEGLSLEEQGESAREFVEGLVRLLELPGTVTMSIVDDSTVQVAVDGPELGILVGPGGGTLTAVQELARTVVQRRTGGRSDRILVDVAGYRVKRAAALQRFTRQVVEEVLASLSERALEPMSASDRKVVHDTVNEIEGVVTRSVGEEPRRYIVVAPEPAQSETEGAGDG